MRHKGRITDWNDDRGFGFIAPALGGERVFVHIKSFADRDRRPSGREIVTYELQRDSRGRPQGANVVFSGARPGRASRDGRGTGLLLPAALFLSFVAGAAVAGRLPLVVPGVYVVGSVLAYLVYSWDKDAAGKDRQRVPESTLHLLGLLGGWPGALVAQRMLRHKSRKRSFQVVFWGTVGLNCSVLIWMLAGMQDPLG